MRIGIDVRCLAEGKRTGVEEYVIGLLGELFNQDTENEYVLFFNARRYGIPEIVTQWADEHPHVSVRAFRFPNKLLNLLFWYLSWPKLDRLVGGTDIFFLPNLNFAAVSRKTKLVVTAHDLSFELYPETFSWQRRFWHFLVDFRRLVRRADRIIAVSQSTKSDLSARYGIPASRITVIHSGIDPRFAPLSRNDESLLAVKERYQLPYRFILSLGTFEPRKNVVALVRAYEALMDLKDPVLSRYQLVLAGTRGWKCEDIYRTIEQSPYRSKIILTGFVDDRDKPALYNLAAVFAYPSIYEGFGFPPLEAMASGVPTIVSHSSSLPEVVGDAGIMIDPYRPDELFRALEETLRDQELLRSLRERGLARAAAFSWSRTAEQTLELFRLL
jgi:glycosyltransferase involved in cell wall biosynthesis